MSSIKDRKDCLRAARKRPTREGAPKAATGLRAVELDARNANDALAGVFAEELRRGLCSAAEDPPHDDPDLLLDKVINGYRLILIRQHESPGSARLSPRELEIARLISKGYPNKTVAAVLEISSWTVGTHLRRIFAKLGVTSRAAMVLCVSKLDPGH